MHSSCSVFFTGNVTGIAQTCVTQRQIDIRNNLAVRVGFEPTEPVKVQRFSSPSRAILARPANYHFILLIQRFPVVFVLSFLA